jgi:hypothetical protein
MQVYAFLKKIMTQSQRDEIVRVATNSGIENNNGWIRIESEADYENLSFKCLVFTDKENEYTYTQYCNSFTISETEKITHYRLIEKHAKPIY